MRPNNFNPRARWDNNIPNSEKYHSEENPEILNKVISVTALFKEGRIYPLSFILDDKEYPIAQITYNWQERRGREIINHFSVLCAENIYHLTFNNTSFGWRLIRIID